MIEQIAKNAMKGSYFGTVMCEIWTEPFLFGPVRKQECKSAHPLFIFLINFSHRDFLKVV